MLRATARARIGGGIAGPGAALWVEATTITEPAPAARARELAPEYKALLTSILAAARGVAGQDAVQRMTDLSELADAAGYAGWIDTAAKVRLLATPDVERAAELAARRRPRTSPSTRSAEKINNDVREGMEKSQREFLLRQQLAAIRKELGELTGEPDGYEPTTAPGSRPPTCRTTSARRPCARSDRLERTPDASPEAGWIRTWLDTVLEMPWATRTTDTHRHRRRARRARRRPRRPRRRQGPDPRVPRGAQPARRARARGRRRPRLGRGARPRRARPGSARPPSASPSPARSAARSSGCRSAASGTRRRSAVTGAPTSARCPAGSSGR